METTEILRRITSNLDREVHSKFTQRQTDLYLEMCHEFKTTLDEKQLSFFHSIMDCGSGLESCCFEDGICFGIKLATEANKLISNPERAFKELQATYSPFEEYNQYEIEALKEFKKYKNEHNN